MAGGAHNSAVRTQERTRWVLLGVLSAVGLFDLVLLNEVALPGAYPHLYMAGGGPGDSSALAVAQPLADETETPPSSLAPVGATNAAGQQAAPSDQPAEPAASGDSPAAPVAVAEPVAAEPEPAPEPVAAEPESAPEPVAAESEPTDPSPGRTGAVPHQRIHFSSNSAFIGARARRVLREVAVTLRSHRERRVLLRGFTDSRGDETGNIGLSRRRSERVRDFLVRLGANRGQVEAEWRGEQNPLDTRDTPDAWSRNRRVEIIWRQ